MKKRLCCWLIAALMTTGLAASAAAAEQLFLLDWIIYGKHAPFFAAKDFGFFKKQGLELRIERGFGSGDTAKRIAAKAAPFGFADTGAALGVRVAGGKVVEVGMIHANAPYAIYTLKKKAIKDPKDLKGYKFGSPPGNAARIVFPAFARRAGLNPADVTWLDMKYGAMLPSLLTGRVDAIPDYTTGGVTHMGKGKDAGKIVTEYRYTNVGFDLYSNGLIVREDTIRDKPGMVRRWVKANMEAWAHCLLYTQKCLDNFYKYAPGMSKKLVDGHFVEAINLLIDDGVKRNGLGWMDPKKMDFTVDIMTKYTPLKKRIPTKDLYTNKFLPQVGQM
ncbi:MAG: ABC transporter substrate-binding protein [Nitrospinota bacterium]